MANPSQEYPDDTIYKKWFKSSSKSGFLSLRHWFDGGKLNIDIGELNGNDLKGNTSVYAPVFELGTYLRAVSTGTGKRLYPEPRNGNYPAESYVYYGGGKVEGQAVSRILKITYWQNGKGDSATYDENAFSWKTGHFKARESAQGAFVPDMKSPLSANLIKVTRTEMAEMSYRLELAIAGYLARKSDGFEHLSGGKR